MKDLRTLAIALCLGVASFTVGCSSHSSGGTVVVVPGSPKIVVHNGYQGYYLNNNFCYWGNNYCGTGNAYGISIPVIIYLNGYYGYYVNSAWCDWTNDYCGTALSWGIINNGTYCDYTYCGGSNYSGTYSGYGSGSYTGNGSGNGSGSGSGSGSYTGNGSGNGSGSGSGSGSYTGNGSGNGSGSGSGNYSSSGSGSYTGNGSGNGSGSGNYSGSGSGNYTGSGSGNYSGSGSGNSSGSYSGNGSGSGSGNGSGNGSGTGSAVVGGVKDVDLQRAALQRQELDKRAQAVASQFQMDFESARSLTQLADRMQALSATGKLTDEDRMALADTAMAVAKIGTDDATAAFSQMIKNNDRTAVDRLIEKAASNLGMPSSAALRDQILPSLGFPVK